MSLKVSRDGISVGEHKLDFGDFDVPFDYLANMVSRGTNGKEVRRFSHLCQLVSHDAVSGLKRSSKEDLISFLGELSQLGYTHIKKNLDDCNLDELRGYCHGVVDSVRSNLGSQGVNYKLV